METKEYWIIVSTPSEAWKDLHRGFQLSRLLPAWLRNQTLHVPWNFSHWIGLNGQNGDPSIPDAVWAHWKGDWGERYTNDLVAHAFYMREYSVLQTAVSLFHHLLLSSSNANICQYFAALGLDDGDMKFEGGGLHEERYIKERDSLGAVVGARLEGDI